VKYYLLTWQSVIGASASSFAPEEVQSDQKLISSLTESESLPFDFTLVNLTPHRNGLEVTNELSGIPDIWPDYMPNNLAWPLVSPKMKKIIDGHLTHDEELYWLSANVNGGGETREYYVVRFDSLHDGLDTEKTTYVPGTDHVIRPWFASAKLNDLSIFPLPQGFDLWRITSSLYVRESLKQALETERVTGVAFEQARVS